MVLPLVIGGVMAAGAIAQYMNSEAGRKASAAERARLQEILDKIQTPELDASGTQAAKFDMSKLTPEDYKVVAQYVPQAAPYIAEAAPHLVENTADMKEGRSAQLSALRKLSGIAGQAQDPAMMQAMNEAQRRSQMEAQARQASVLQDAQRRGVGGSGLSIALAAQGGANAMNSAAEQSQRAAADAYKNRLQALMQSAELGGNIRSQDAALQGKNADIINAFNARTAQAQQGWANQRADLANAAQRYNIGQTQDTADKNTALHNTTAEKERARKDDIARYYADWAQKQKEFQNSVKQQGFQNEMKKYDSSAGISNSTQAAIAQGTQDRGNMIGGLVNAAGTYGMGQNNADMATAAQDRADRRAYFEKNGKWPD